MYRRGHRRLELFLVHPGGPFFAKKDAGAWSIPKGEVEPGEELLAVARREFGEETGQTVEACGGREPFVELGTVRLKSGKLVHAWGFAGEWPEGVALSSTTFTLEWPPRSGRMQQFPEVDRGQFFPFDEARVKVNPGQVELIERLAGALGGG